VHGSDCDIDVPTGNSPDPCMLLLCHALHILTTSLS